MILVNICWDYLIAIAAHFFFCLCERCWCNTFVTLSKDLKKHGGSLQTHHRHTSWALRAQFCHLLNRSSIPSSSGKQKTLGFVGTCLKSLLSSWQIWTNHRLLTQTVCWHMHCWGMQQILMMVTFWISWGVSIGCMKAWLFPVLTLASSYPDPN